MLMEKSYDPSNKKEITQEAKIKYLIISPKKLNIQTKLAKEFPWVRVVDGTQLAHLFTSNFIEELNTNN